MDKCLWIEKYRPTKMSELVISDDTRKIFEEYIKNKNIPHLLLEGIPGSGKTTIARILVNEIIGDEESDVLVFNGSTETGVDIIRDNIASFLSTPSYNESGLKIVYIDEADHLSSPAQAALRGTVEKFHKDGGRFIFTANYAHKVKDAVDSRFTTFKFQALPKNFIKDYIKSILRTENIKYEEDVLKYFIDCYYPDIRKTINQIQSNSLFNELKLTDSSDIIEIEIINRIIDLLNDIMNNETTRVSIKLNKIQDLLSKNPVNHSIIYNNLFNDSNIPYWAKIFIGESFDGLFTSPSQNLHFMTMLFKIFKMGVQRNNLSINGF